MRYAADGLPKWPLYWFRELQCGEVKSRLHWRVVVAGELYRRHWPEACSSWLWGNRQNVFGHELHMLWQHFRILFWSMSTKWRLGGGE